MELVIGFAVLIGIVFLIAIAMSFMPESQKSKDRRRLVEECSGVDAASEFFSLRGRRDRYSGNVLMKKYVEYKNDVDLGLSVYKSLVSVGHSHKYSILLANHFLDCVVITARLSEKFDLTFSMHGIGMGVASSRRLLISHLAEMGEVRKGEDWESVCSLLSKKVHQICSKQGWYQAHDVDVPAEEVALTQIWNKVHLQLDKEESRIGKSHWIIINEEDEVDPINTQEEFASHVKEVFDDYDLD